MQDIIRLLPEALANQIAAGEVVQRPSSVAKEMLENSVDAQAEEVILIVKDAGKTLIQVVDNGIGMSSTDARMCFERHATSKIRSQEDLYAIRTLGFRGEAMASIAAVAQIELKTKRAEDDLGTHIYIEGSELKTHESISCAEGTSIAVKNLFFNTPARRKFLKSNTVELRNIIDEFIHVALANPHIGFSLIHNDKEVYRLVAGKLAKRIIDLLGKMYQKNLLPIKEDVQYIEVGGFLGNPQCAKRVRGEQYFFVNNRFIKHHYLHHAVVSAYERLIPSDTFPFYCLFIKIDPERVDVNVHPTKTEIKFDDERAVYAVIHAAVKHALGLHNVASAIDFELDTNFATKLMEVDKPHSIEDFNANYRSVGSSTAHDSANSSAVKRTQSEIRKEINSTEWESFYQDLLIEAKSKKEPENPALSFVTLQSAANQNFAQKTIAEDKKPFQADFCFVICQIKSVLLVVEQQSAHERILYERYLENLHSNSGTSQQNLFPRRIELNAADFALLRELEIELVGLGFDLSFEDEHRTIFIKGMPTGIGNVDEEQLLNGLLEQYRLNQNEISLNYQENLARALARRTSIKRGDVLTSEEMTHLIDELFGCVQPQYAPNGNKTYVILGSDEIASFFV
jgi:DNA mismatch repair protein MutL